MLMQIRMAFFFPHGGVYYEELKKRTGIFLTPVEYYLTRKPKLIQSIRFSEELNNT